MKKEESFTIGLGVLLLAACLVMFTQAPAKDCQSQCDQSDSLFQVSTFSALLEGLFDGDTTVSELREKGDFGIGTFNSLDGEMVALDGVFYQVKDTGAVYAMNDSAETPFASVVFFKADDRRSLEGTFNYTLLQESIDHTLPTENIPYAIKVTGNFSYVKTRAPHMQQPPYPDLVDALANQSIFEARDVEGTLVGFRLPEYVNGVNVAGYHMHFLSADHGFGGHVLDFSVTGPTVETDYKYDYQISLPDAEEFANVELSGDRTEEIEKVEK